MKVRALACSGAEFPGYNPPGFLADGKILFDAGTVNNISDEKNQLMDHIREIPSLADNIGSLGMETEGKHLQHSTCEQRHQEQPSGQQPVAGYDGPARCSSRSRRPKHLSNRLIPSNR